MPSQGSERAQARPGRGGLSLFHLGGIEVRIDFSWFFIFLLVLIGLSTGYFPRFHPELSTLAHWGAGFVTTLLLFTSIVLHELSHAWMAQASGIPVPTITLFLFGGVSEMSEEPEEPATDLKIAAVGPLMSFALAGVAWLVHFLLTPWAPPLASGIALYLIWINLALGVFNLLPGLPLDGGRILRALAWKSSGSLKRGTRIAANAGKGIAIGLMILGAIEIFAGALVGGIWLILIGLFLRGTAEAGYQNLVILHSLEDVDVGDVAIRDPVTVPPQTSIQSLIDDYLLTRGYRSYPVVDDGRALGVISVDAIRDVPVEERSQRRVEQSMVPVSDEMKVTPDTPLSVALKKLMQSQSGRLLVQKEGGALEGMLTKEGLSRFMEIRQVIDSNGGGKADSADSQQSQGGRGQAAA